MKNLLLPSFAILSILLGMGLLGYLPVGKLWPPTFFTSEAGSNDIVINARGTNGEEKIGLFINDIPVQFWNLSTSFQDYTYTPPNAITVNNLSIHFLNDRWEPENNINYDAQIDYITVNGTRYDSEHSSTASTGSWDQNNWCAPGNKSQEWLHCAGSFTYNIPAGTVVGTPTATPINGTCGSAENSPTNTTPTANLCAAGSATTPQENTTNNSWDWNCQGSNGGSTKACSVGKGQQSTVSASPVTGTTLFSSSQQFTIDAPTEYLAGIWVGSTRDSSNYYNSGSLSGNRSFTAQNLPTDGSTVHMRVTYREQESAPLQFQYYEYSAADSGGGGGLDSDVTISPANGTILSGSSQQFTITAPAGHLVGAWIGSGTDQDNYYNTGALVQNGTFTASGWPGNGSDVFVRVAYKESSSAPVQFEYFQWTAHTNTSGGGGGFDHACANPSFQYTKLTNATSPSNTSGGLRVHHYPTVSAWNADDNLIFLPKYNGGVYDLSGNELYPNIPFAVLANGNIGSYFWDKSNPYKMYGVRRGGTKLVSIDVRNPNSETVEYNAGTGLVIGADQGVPDDDQTRVIVTTSNSMRILDITRTPATVVYQRSLPSGFDWAGMSHSGKYYTTVSSSGGIEIFEASGTYQKRTAQYSSNHSDFVTDANGVEYMAIVGNPPKLLRLSNGAVTNLGSKSGWGHISGRGPEGRMYYSFDLGGSYGQEIGDIAVGDNFDNRRITWRGHPKHIRETGSYAISQMRVAPSRRGDKLLVAISNPKNVPDQYLVEKLCP